MFSRLTHVISHIKTSLLQLNDVPLWVVSTFWTWWIMLLWMLYRLKMRSSFLTLLDIPPVVELCFMAIVCWIFWETAELFYAATAPFHILTINARGFQTLHVLAKAYFIFSYGYPWVKGRLPVVLIYISLMTDNVEWQFVYLLWRNVYLSLLPSLELLCFFVLSFR